MSEAIICFGQQPCGFYPKRFLVAKINTARKIQKEIGGAVVFFYHDSDADYRETITLLKDRQTGADVRLNFTQENKIQKKYSPLYLKRITKDWKEVTRRQLPRFVDQSFVDIFVSAIADMAADFCLEMYRRLGLLDGIEVVRSSDRVFREQALDLEDDYYADIQYEGETVRARVQGAKLKLERGGGLFIDLPQQEIQKCQKSAARDQRFPWMQSMIHVTHYVIGEGETEYLDTGKYPEVKFMKRESIEEPGYAMIDYGLKIED